MHLMRLAGLLIVASVALPAPRFVTEEAEPAPVLDADPTVAAELNRLAGDWVGDYSLRQARTWKVNFAEGTFHAEIPGKEFYSGTIEIDPAATPARIDFVITENDHGSASDVCRAIYRWEDDDHLVLLTPNLNQEPAVEFAGDENDFLFLRRASLP